ncbi:MAG TPA: hypothetical protein VHE79_09510, partial [Spirochaetia bacterium]
APEDFLVETFMMGLRTARGIPTRALRGRFGAGVDELYPGLWERWVDAGWAHPATDSLRLTETGMMLLDMLVEELIDVRAVPRARVGGDTLRVTWP